MAMAMASAAAHSAPPFPLPALPRVRPPPIPKGTPAPSLIPMPNDPIQAKTRVWSDGKWRDPSSSSAKNKREIESIRLEKALRHETHGMNIYAYKHVATHQVVYSLTKIMQSQNILKQLIFHGKQTKEAKLRRDVWRPYFSVHFPQNPSGAAKGLRVYRELRELSAKRQLSPPKELVIATQQDVDDMARQFNPNAWAHRVKRMAPGFREIYPFPGKPLPTELKAKKLMDMRGSSVADVAAVLKRHAGLVTSPIEYLRKAKEKRAARELGLSKRAKGRLNKIREAEVVKAQTIEERKTLLMETWGRVPIDKYVRARIALEHEGTTNAGRGVGQLLALEKKKEETAAFQGPEVELNQTLEAMQQEKLAAIADLDETLKQELAELTQSMSQDERMTFEAQVQQEKAQKLAEYDQRLAEATTQMNERRDQLRKKLDGEADPTGAAPRKSLARAELKNLSRSKSTPLIRQLQKERNEVEKYGSLPGDALQRLNDITAEIDEKYGQRLEELRSQIGIAQGDEHDVLILWNDPRNGSFVNPDQWHESVRHEILQPKAAIKKGKMVVRQHEFLDEDEEKIEEQKAYAEVAMSNTVHVFGSEQPFAQGEKGRYVAPTELAEMAIETRHSREKEWAMTETVLVRKAIVEKRLAIEESGLELSTTDIPSSLANLHALSTTLEELQQMFSDLDALRADGATPPEEIERNEQTITNYIEWLRDDVLPVARTEIESHNQSLTPTSTTAPIPTTSLTHASRLLELYDIESRYPAARTQANLYTTLATQLRTRATLEEQLYAAREELAEDASTPAAVMESSEAFISAHRSNPGAAPQLLQEALARYIALEDQLETLDREFPLLPRAVARKQELVAQREDVAAQLQQAEAGSDDAAQLEAQVKELERQVRKVDDETWIEWRNSNGGVDVDYYLDRSGAQTTQEDDVVVPDENKGIFSRVKSLFGGR